MDVQLSDSATEELVTRLHPLVARIARARFGDGDEAEDIVQETLTRVVTRMGQWTGRVPIEHWASRIAVNLCCDRHRLRVRRHEVPLAEQGAAPPDHFAARDQVEVLLARLGAEDRLVIVLMDLEQRGTREIAALTGWSRVAIKVRAMRARRKLRALAAHQEECHE